MLFERFGEDGPLRDCEAKPGEESRLAATVSMRRR